MPWGGQAAASVAEAFHEALELDGIILTKLDSDARGGAVLSARETVGRPVVFASTGERIGDFELFHPDRMAGRILGKGDVLGLIEKTEEAFEQAEAEAAAERLIAGTYTLDDFLDQMRQIRKLGPLSGLLGRMPGMSGTEIDRPDERKTPHPHGSHHLLHDPDGEVQTRNHQQLPPPAHRTGQRHRHSRCLQADSRVHQRPQADAVVRATATQGEAQQERQKGRRQGHPEGHGFAAAGGGACSKARFRGWTW